MLDSKSAPNYKTKSGWNSLLPQRVPHEELPADKRYKNIIIGAGYTGLAVANRLAELAPDEEILLIESSVIGEGSSGRNSGYLLVNPGEPSANASGFTEDWASQQMSMAQAGFDLLRNSVIKHQIECNWNEKPLTITSAVTPRVVQSARQTRQKYCEWGLNPKEYTLDDFKRIAGTEYYSYGLQSLTRALVQPAALHRGLADNLPASVTLLENTLVSNIGDSSPFSVETSRGVFVADRVFVTNNLHARVFGIAKSQMAGFYTYGAFTPELDQDQLDLLGEEPDWGILPAHRMGTTMRKTSGRLLIRSGDSYEKEMNPHRAKSMLTTLYKSRFPQMKNHDFEFVWGGLTAITHNGSSYFGEPKKGLFASVGCGGAGVVRGTIHGKLLADYANGIQSDHLTNRLSLKQPNWLPPEPFRQLGASTQIAFERWLAGADR